MSNPLREEDFEMLFLDIWSKVLFNIALYSQFIRLGII